MYLRRSRVLTFPPPFRPHSRQNPPATPSLARPRPPRIPRLRLLPSHLILASSFPPQFRISNFDCPVSVHSGAKWCTMELMKTQEKSVRQSVSLPAKTAAQVRNLAKTRRLSSNRMLVELIENGIEAEKRKQQEFFELAERFRNASDPEEAKRLGEALGRMVFGD